MSDTTNLEKMIMDLTDSVKSIEVKVWSIESHIDSMKSEMGSMKSEMNSGFRRLEELALDTRDEMRTENIATRTLLNQAFTHISDQLMRDGDTSFAPSYPRVKR